MGDVIPPRVPNGLAEVIAAYGDPAPHIVHGDWVVDPQWEMKYMTTLAHPFLPHGKIYCNRVIVDMLRNVLDDWQTIGGYTIRTFGCYAPRAQRGSNGFVMSIHTVGAAFDLNADQNPIIYPCYPSDPRRTDPANCDIPVAWIEAAKARGWFWGGEFSRRFDPQHFQAATGF